MRRRLAVALVLAAVGIADADPPSRKTAPDKFAKAAGEAFAEAVAADQKGDLKTALGLYLKAFAIAPHPNAIFNTADVQRRLGMLPDAIRSYEMYLALSSSSADRKIVEAIVEKLSKTPGTMQVSTEPPSDPRSIDLKSAYVLIDGEIVRKPGPLPPPAREGAEPMLEIPFAAGNHTVDIVTPITYGTRQCNLTPGGRGYCKITADPRIDGSIVISDGGRDTTVRVDASSKPVDGSRFELPAGRHKLRMKDRHFECPALVVDVPASGDLAYVFTDSAEYVGLQRCRSFTVKRHVLHFTP